MPNREHRELRSVRASAGDNSSYRAACSCGWTSEPVAAADTVTAWENHVRELGARGIPRGH